MQRRISPRRPIKVYIYFLLSTRSRMTHRLSFTLFVDLHKGNKGQDTFLTDPLDPKAFTSGHMSISLYVFTLLHFLHTPVEKIDQVFLSMSCSCTLFTNDFFSATFSPQYVCVCVCVCVTVFHGFASKTFHSLYFTNKRLCRRIYW